MLFNSLSYLIFLPIVVTLFWLCPLKWRVPLLLVASYIFYMFWNPVYIFLIIALTAVNYAFGLVLGEIKKNRKLVFWSGIAANLLVLGFFKYTYFIHDTINDVVKLFGQGDLAPIPIKIILPLGISFFVFEFIHYLTDIYRGDKPVKSFMQFALFPSFFPTQIAGPIKRYQDFIPQLTKDTKLTMKEFNEGFELIIFGLFKKVCLADTVAVVVNRCFAHPELLNGADAWLATALFVIQLYFDFSGYTDVARGSAMLMGFSVPINFNLPSLAGSVTDFFQRWHISLSNWLKDYLFTPLGGASRNVPRTAFNVIVTFTLAGLWHGPAMHFVLWGTYFGLLLIIHRAWALATWRWKKAKSHPAYHGLAIALSFASFCIAGALFRSHDLPTAGGIIGKMLFLDSAGASLAALQPTILNTKDNVLFLLAPEFIVLFFIFQVICSKFKGTPGCLDESKFFPGFKPVYLAGLMIFLLVFAPEVTPSYVYFQF